MFWKKLNEYFVKRWILSAFLLTIPTYWIAFVKLLGSKTGLVNKTGEITLVAIIITIVVFIFTLLFALIKTFQDKRREEERSLSELNCTNNQIILQAILDSINSVCGKKANRFLTYIKEKNAECNLNPFIDITQPESQIEDLLEEIRVCFSSVLGIKRDNIGVSILYKYVKGKWDWYHSINTLGRMSIDDIVKNNNTSARQIMDGKTDTVFYPDKRIGIAENKYLPDKKDIQNGSNGSIICRNISIKDDRCNYISAILSISTYGNVMCEADNENAKNTIINIMLPPFEARIKRELSLAYIKNKMIVNKTKAPKKAPANIPVSTSVSSSVNPIKLQA